MTPIDDDELGDIHGGGFFGRAWNVAKETFGYAGPAGASEAASAIPAAAHAAMLVPQANARNDLIRKLSSEGSGQAADRAFDRYHNGPGQKLAKAAASE